jgi:hypothetical protein
MKPQIGSLRGLSPVSSLCCRNLPRRLFVSFCGLVFLLGKPQAGSAFSLNGYRWPSGSQITMHLQLSRAPVAFQDGSVSWNASAADALAIWNQYLELHDATGAIVGQNDNWNAHRADVLATGIPPTDEHEAVIAISLQPGRYTVVLRGVDDSSGVALVEAYDLSPNSNSKLANISTRGKVETGDDVMIGGFIIGGDQRPMLSSARLGLP